MLNVSCGVKIISMLVLHVSRIKICRKGEQNRVNYLHGVRLLSLSLHLLLYGVYLNMMLGPKPSIDFSMHSQTKIQYSYYFVYFSCKTSEI